MYYFGAANLCSEPLNFSTQSGIFLLCSIECIFRLQSSKTACIGTESGPGQLPGLRSARGGVAGLEQRGVGKSRAPGRCSWGPSEARCAPLVRLLLLSDPGSWCSGTRKHQMHLPSFVPRTVASLGSNSGARSSTRAPVDAAGGGRREPGAPPWCGCCSSLTLVLGAVALGAA